MGRGSIVHECDSLDGKKAHTRIEYGRSISTQAESGEQVQFSCAFPSPPNIVMSKFQEKETWIEVSSITETGFTWFATVDRAGIDWMAIGEI